jgi:hypothetical protein
VQVDLPQLAQRVGLDEVAFVMDVEAVVDRLTLQVRHESCYVDDCHTGLSVPLMLPAASRGHYRPRK